jgi:hypothetical protein
MAPDRQVLLVCRSGNPAVYVCEATAAGLIPDQTLDDVYSDESATFNLQPLPVIRRAGR